MEENEILNLLICDNHHANIRGVKEMLSGMHFKIEYWETKDKMEMRRKIESKKIKMVIACIRKEDNNCFDAIIEIQTAFPELKILVITDCINTGMIKRLVEAEIMGILHDNHNEPELRKAVLQLLDGDYAYIDIAKTILKSFKQRNKEGIKVFKKKSQ